jgi:hypothetical protein
MIECPMAETLFEDYIRATRDHIDAVVRLDNMVGSPEQFAVGKAHAQQTYERCQAAFSALQKHGLEHNCFLASFAPASQSNHHLDPAHDRYQS